MLLILVMLLSMLGGCFKITKKTTGESEDTTNPQTSQTTTDGDNPAATTQPGQTTQPGETYEDGYELTAFLDGYTDAKAPLWEKMSDAVEEGADFTALSALLGMSFADMMILDVYFFDSVEEMGGAIMFTAIDNAYKRVNGDVIEFGYDYIYSEDKADDNYPAGSHLTCVGTFNTKTGRIFKEAIDDKGPGNVTRTVIEINRLAADSYVSQFITCSEDSAGSEVTGYFTFFKGTDIWSAQGVKTEGTNFTFNSINNRVVGLIDDMTAGFEIKSIVSYVGDELEYEVSE